MRVVDGSHTESVFAVVADGLYWTPFHGLLALRFLFWRGRLFENVGISPIVAAFEISGRGFPAQVAVNALIIHVIFSRHVNRVFVRNVGHRLSFVSCNRAHVISAGPASHAGPSIQFRLRASDFLKQLLVKRVGGAMVPDKRFIKVFSLERIGQFDWR